MFPKEYRAQRYGRTQPRHDIADDALGKGALRQLVGSDLDVWHSCDLKVTALPVRNQFANVIVPAKMAQGFLLFATITPAIKIHGAYEISTKQPGCSKSLSRPSQSSVIHTDSFPQSTTVDRSLDSGAILLEVNLPQHERDALLEDLS